MILLYDNYTRDDFLIHRSVFPVDELYVMLSGSFRCIIEGTEFIVKENDIFTLSKHNYFEREVLTPIHYLYLQFDRFPIPLKTGVIQVRDLVRLQSSARYLETAIKAHDLAKIEHYVDDIFYLFNDTNSVPAVVEDDIARRCLSYLRCNYSDHSLNLEALAKEYNISKNNLINTYKRTYHKTPMADLVNIRIEKSKDFLKRPQYPIYWIAKQCGFENTYYFSNTFKKKTGISPSKFRQLTLTDNTKKNNTE